MFIKWNRIDKSVKDAKNAKLQSIKHRDKIEKKMLEDIFSKSINPAIRKGESQCKYEVMMGEVPSFVINRLEMMGYVLDTYHDPFNPSKVVAVNIKW